MSIYAEEGTAVNPLAHLNVSSTIHPNCRKVRENAISAYPIIADYPLNT
jgi:hypothetical protein